MGNKKKEHVVFDRMERVKSNINKKNFVRSNNYFDQLKKPKCDIKDLFNINKTDNTKFKPGVRLKESDEFS